MSSRCSSGRTSKPDILKTLNRAPLEPALWNDACDALAGLVGASGALLIPYDVEDRTIAMPHSPSMAPVLASFIETGWHKRDFRTSGFPRALTVGFVTDQDLISIEDMRRHPYYEEWLASVGLRWFAGFCFKVGSKTWGAAVHGTAERGPFISSDIEALLSVRNHFSLAAKQTEAIGSQRISSLEASLSAAYRGTAVLTGDGRIGWLNARADELLRSADLLSRNRISSQDAATNHQLSQLLHRALAFRTDAGVVLASPVRVFTADERTLSIDAIPMPRDFQSLLSSASVLVTIHEVEPLSRHVDSEFRTRFRLTPRELEICINLLSGNSISKSSVMMGTSVATARQYVKSIFAKTDTHSQSELITLLAKMPYAIKEK